MIVSTYIVFNNWSYGDGIMKLIKQNFNNSQLLLFQRSEFAWSFAGKYG